MINFDRRDLMPGLLVQGIVLLVLALIYVQTLADYLARKELYTKQMVSQATRLMSVDYDYEDVYNYLLEVVTGNEYIPVILMQRYDPDSLHAAEATVAFDARTDSVVATRNLGQEDSIMSYDAKVEALIDMIDDATQPLVYDIGGNYTHMLFIGDSAWATMLSAVPWIGVTTLTAYVIFAVYIIRRRKKKEENIIWIGLARETAHQLGTPITSLVGWRDLMLMGDVEPSVVADEMTKDIDRLQSVADRFSKIGSLPEMHPSPIADELQSVVNYLERRLPSKVTITLYADDAGRDAKPKHNDVLMKWAVENICRNAADAIEAEGNISINVTTERGCTLIDISDTGKGMDKKTQRRIFNAGYTTKKRGWGLGLALVRRIVVEYHHGDVSVLRSTPGVGTTFRIKLWGA